jgi:hypothetical protein
LNSKLHSPPQVLFLTSKPINLWKNKIPLFVVVIPKSRFRNEYAMVATSFSKRPIHNPYTHPTALTVARAMAPADSYIIPIDHLKTWLVDHNFVMDRLKLVDDEAVGQSLATEVVSNEPLMGPDPSVSTGTAKSAKLNSIM